MREKFFRAGAGDEAEFGLSGGPEIGRQFAEQELSGIARSPETETEERYICLDEATAQVEAFRASRSKNDGGKRIAPRGDSLLAQPGFGEAAPLFFHGGRGKEARGGHSYL